MSKSRRERRAEARQTKTPFKPEYNAGLRPDGKGSNYLVGGAPRTYQETYGVGYERFNNKYITITEASEVIEVTAEETTEEPTTEEAK